jgi:hypothetical protein
MIPKSGYRFSEKDHAPTKALDPEKLALGLDPRVAAGFRKKIMRQLTKQR